jgi:hypothetical protein
MKAYFNQNRLSTRGWRRCRFSQDVALHLHARQLGSQPADLHLLGAHGGLAVCALELALLVGLDPIEQRLVDHAQCSRRRRNALAALEKPNRLLLEFGRVPRSTYIPCKNAVSVKRHWKRASDHESTTIK